VDGVKPFHINFSSFFSSGKVYSSAVLMYNACDSKMLSPKLKKFACYSTPRGAPTPPYTPFRYPYVNFIDLIKVSVEMLNV